MIFLMYNDPEQIIGKIKEDNTVVESEILSDDMKKRILEIELRRLDEMIPVVNKGLNDAFESEYVAVIIKRNDVQAIPMASLELLTKSGKLIGEEVYDEDELEEYRNRDDVYFISDNFVSFTNVSGMEAEEQYFLISEVGSKILGDIDLSNVKDMIMAIPSADTNDFFLKHYGYSTEDSLGSVLIGFTVE